MLPHQGRLLVKYVGLGLLCLVVLTISAYPLMQLLKRSIWFNGNISFIFYSQVLTNPNYWRAFLNSLVVSGISTFAAAVLGSGLALIITRTNVWGRTVLRKLLILPYFIPPFISAFAWRGLLGPAGYLNQLYMHLFGASAPLFNIYGPVGIIFVLTIRHYPLFLLILTRALEQMNPELEEAAEVCGASTRRVLSNITLRVTAPAFLGAATLVFAGCMSNFGVPAVLGLPKGYYVMTTVIYSTVLNYFMRNNLAFASVLSIWLCIAALGVLGVQHWVTSRGKYVLVTGKARPSKLIPLGHWRIPVTMLCYSVVAVAVVAPFVSLVLLALTRAYGLPPTWNNLTLQHFLHLLDDALILTGLKNSTILAVAAATGAVVLGFIIAYLKIRMRYPIATVLEYLSSAPYVIPGTVIGVSMILSWINPIPILGISIYNTLWILWVAYLARYLALSVMNLESALQQYHNELEEAACVSGAHRLRIIRDVVLPLTRGNVLSSWLLVFTPALTELTVSILLYGPRKETIGVVAFLLIQEGRICTAASLSIIMILFVYLGNFLASFLSKGRVALW